MIRKISWKFNEDWWWFGGEKSLSPVGWGLWVWGWGGVFSKFKEWSKPFNITSLLLNWWLYTPCILGQFWNRHMWCGVHLQPQKKSLPSNVYKYARYTLFWNLNTYHMKMSWPSPSYLQLKPEYKCYDWDLPKICSKWSNTGNVSPKNCYKKHKTHRAVWSSLCSDLSPGKIRVSMVAKLLNQDIHS